MKINQLLLLLVLVFSCTRATECPTYGFFTSVAEHKCAGSFLEDKRFTGELEADKGINFTIENDVLSLNFDQPGRFCFIIKDKPFNFRAWNKGFIVHFSYRLRSEINLSQEASGLRFEVSALRDAKKISDSDATIPDGKFHQPGIWYDVSIPFSSVLRYDEHVFDFEQFSFFSFRSRQKKLALDLKDFYIELGPIGAYLNSNHLPIASQQKDGRVFIWTGKQNSLWTLKENWALSRPTAQDIVVIMPSAHNPVTSGTNEELTALMIESELTINGGSLLIHDKLIIGDDTPGKLIINGGKITVIDDIIIGIHSKGSLVINSGSVTVVNKRLSLSDDSDAVLEMNGGLLYIQGREGLRSPDGSNSSIIYLRGGIIHCTFFESKARGLVVFQASEKYPHGGILLTDKDQSLFGNSTVPSHPFIANMIRDGWIVTEIPGHKVTVAYDTREYPGKTVVRSVPDR